MSSFYVVVDDLGDWGPYYPSKDVISFDQYLALADSGAGRVRVLNFCRNSRPLGRGYYCSLLAEARGQHVIPSVRVISDLRRKSLYSLQLDGLSQTLDKLAKRLSDDQSKIELRIFFGETRTPELTAVAKQLFERFPSPVLEVRLKRHKVWQVESIRQLALREITDEADQELFAAALERFSNRIWLKPRARKRYRYDLAMLVDPDEALPPSDKEALKRFVASGRQLGINVEMIGKRDLMRLPEYDGLFIRETTAVDHHTYRFAKKAEAEGLVVMDDPTSILRCTNKIYLAELLKTNRVATPATSIVSNADKTTVDQMIASLGFPMVLKIPDGAFSRGMCKVETREELVKGLKELLQSSSLVLAQEFLYTDYDWRIGVLNNKPLYACRYYMVKDHWQIYRHGNAGDVDSGGFDTLPTYEVPPAVLEAALKATRLIGDGLYGVDLKQSGDRVVVIEVNDNPSVDSDVEDRFLGTALYHEIMAEFLRRMELNRR
ncbi:MAG: RimK family protein [Oceanospirillaceae bacterium]|nr:RimK family protein [Oceanospirillaceae bacterium]